MATILVDTRQQESKHERKHNDMERMGHTLVRSKLHVGDYALPPSESVDTKRNIAELAQDVWKDHDRFRRELVAARDDGTHLTILVENEHGVESVDDLARWYEPDHERARRRGKRNINGKTLAKACLTMQRTYGCTFMFCKPEDAASLIEGILIGGVNGGHGAGYVEDDGGPGSRDVPCAPTG